VNDWIIGGISEECLLLFMLYGLNLGFTMVCAHFTYHYMVCGPSYGLCTIPDDAQTLLNIFFQIIHFYVSNINAEKKIIDKKWVWLMFHKHLVHVDFS